MRNFSIPENLLNHVVQLLNGMPAIQSRPALNALEAIVQQQGCDPGRPTDPYGGGGPGEPKGGGGPGEPK